MKNTVNNLFYKWFYFSLLCVIWGSSFILMKLGLYGSHGTPLLIAYQVAAIRLLSAGVVLIPFFIKAIRRIPRSSRGYVIGSGLLGNLFPAFLFCVAETKIDSSLAAMLNCLTPICAVLVAAFLYKTKIPTQQAIGVVLGFAGCVLLFLAKKGNDPGDLAYAAYVLLATLCYGMNVNMVRHRLAGVASLDIAAGSLVAFIIPCLVILWITGFHQLPLLEKEYVIATVASATLGILGTAVATVIFYHLVKLAGPVFSSMVTYGIPFVAIAWGFWYGESITLLQVGALLIILGGVYIAGKKRDKIKVTANEPIAQALDQ